MLKRKTELNSRLNVHHIGATRAARWSGVVCFFFKFCLWGFFRQKILAGCVASSVELPSFFLCANLLQGPPITSLNVFGVEGSFWLGSISPNRSLVVVEAVAVDLSIEANEGDASRMTEGAKGQKRRSR